MTSFPLQTNIGNTPNNSWQKIIERGLPGCVLLALIAFSFAKFFRHPYGFGWEPNGEIYIIFVEQPEPTIRVGDQLIQVGSQTWETFHNDLRRTLFEGTQPGEVANITVERDGRTLTVPWRLPGVNKGEVLDQLFSEWFLSYIFWIVGTLALLFLRPRDERWWLLSVFNFLTAIWLIAGGLSNYHIWYSAIVLRLAIWLSVPVYLHFHWVFPRPLGRLPTFLVGLVYGLAVALMLAQFFQAISQNLYFLGFIIAVFGSLILLLIHSKRQPESRAELRLIWIATIFALAPLLAIAAVSFINGSSRADAMALLSFPILPLAYLYTAYRNQLGGLEVRVNRLFSAYFFGIILATVGAPLLALADRLITPPDAPFIVGFFSAALATIVSIWLFPPFQNFVERRWLGISLPSKQLPLIYSRHATTSTSLDVLIELLQKDVLPSLLIREFVFLRVDGTSPEVALAVGIHPDRVLRDEQLSNLETLKSIALSFTLSQPARSPGWVRLMLILGVGDSVLGYWLFGRRDPDDLYPQAEIPILQSLADQTAITLSNIIKTDRLRVAYQADINRFEEERLRLALELHDSILNKMAALLMKLDDRSLTPAFQDSYNELSKHLREIVRDLKPALLNYGLQHAFEELADNLMEQSGDKVRITVLLNSNGSSYSKDVERHLFRIVQEACTNALRHAQPTEITITGNLDSHETEIEVRDDGIGFDLNGKQNLNVLLDNDHFGLNGIFERAELIGADVKIESVLTKGTRLRVSWKPGQR